MSFNFIKENFEAFVLMICFSLLGGIASYIKKINAKKALFSFSELVGETVISISAGLTCGLLLIDHATQPVVLACTSLSAHMGTKFFYMLEEVISNKIKKNIGD